MQSPAAKIPRTPEARAELAAASARARLRVDVAKQSVRLAKEEMKRARKRLKEAKREVRRARKRAGAARKAWKETRRKRPAKPVSARVVTATAGTSKQKVAPPAAKPKRAVRRVAKTPAVPDVAPER